MQHTFEFDGIQLSFNERKILSDIYMKCETGQITGLLGRNGQGKSCLMKIVYGDLKIERSVRFDQIACYEPFRRPDLLRYLPQFNFIPGWLSLQRIFKDFELDFGVFSQRFPEFASRLTSPIQRLSGGERRLVELYVIVKSATHFAMLDEPFTHLNPSQIEKVKELLLEEKMHKGLLITDHLYRHIIDISDQLYVLTNGKTHLTKSLHDIERLGYARL